MSKIFVSGLICIKDNKLLLVKKADFDFHLLPGGKIEEGETKKECLAREVQEELGCEITDPIYVGSFESEAAGMPDTIINIDIYKADLVGCPRPCNEIVKLEYFGLDDCDRIKNDLIKDQIMPHLALFEYLVTEKEHTMTEEKEFQSGDEQRVKQTDYVPASLAEDAVFANGDDVSYRYRTLTDEEKEQMARIKMSTQVLINNIKDVSPVNPLPRELQTAVEKAVEASMWTTRFITGVKKAEMEKDVIRTAD